MGPQRKLFDEFTLKKSKPKLDCMKRFSDVILAFGNLEIHLKKIKCLKPTATHSVFGPGQGGRSLLTLQRRNLKRQRKGGHFVFDA